MNIKFFKDQQLETSFHRIVASERKVLHLVILHIQEVSRRKLYLKRGYGSLFSYLMSEMKYSRAAAQRRIEAARLMTAVPAVAEKLQAGDINLSQLGDIQKSVKDAEALHQVKITVEMKASLVEAVVNKTVSETQQICAEALNIPVVRNETVRTQKDNSKILNTTLSEKQMQKFERLRDLLAHKNFQQKRTQKMSDVLETIFDELLAVIDPENLKTSKSKAGVSSKRTGAKMQPAPKTSKNPENTLAGNIETPIQPSGSAGSSASELGIETSDAEAAWKAAEATTCSSAAANSSASESKWKALTPKRKKIVLQTQKCCQFQDRVTGRTCGSTFDLQVDHVHPKWDDGDNRVENLRVLCRQHNLFRYRAES